MRPMPAVRSAEVLAGSLLPRLQIARCQPVAADVALGGLGTLAEAHRQGCKGLDEDLHLHDDGLVDEVAVDAALVGLKAELASRWLENHSRPRPAGWRVAAGPGPQGVEAVVLSQGGNLAGEDAARAITDGYDAGAGVLLVQDPGPGALPALLEVLGQVEVGIPVFLAGELDWPPVPLALLTWLFDRIIIRGAAPADPGRRLWPGMREARFLARIGEEVTYMTGLPTPAGPWRRRLDRWGRRLGITLEVAA